MPNEPTILDISKFNLDAFKVSTELNIKMMEAYANFNFRMMQVAELQTKVATDQVKLAILRHSFENYRLAELEARRRVRESKKKLDQFSTAIRGLNHLLAGETVSVSFVPLGWRGFRFLTSQAQTVTALELSRVHCESGDRLGSCFFNAARPDDVVADAPTRITKALALMDWARRANLVPCLGSGAQNRLADLLTILGSSAANTLTQYQTKLNETEKELARIRETSWDNLNVLEEKPKK